MKYLSLIAVIALLQMTWWVSQKDKALTLSQQNRLLNVIKEYMTQVVKEKDPEASDIKFSNLYTETVDPGRTLKAHFKFSYLQALPSGEKNRVSRRGHFLVTSNDGDQWKARIDEINDVQVQFIEPMEIGPNQADTAVTDETTTETEPAASEAQGHDHSHENH